MRTCKCGGIIREHGKPYWDTLPSCSCANPDMVKHDIVITTTSTDSSSPQPNKECWCVTPQGLTHNPNIPCACPCHTPLIEPEGAERPAVEGNWEKDFDGKFPFQRDIESNSRRKIKFFIHTLRQEAYEAGKKARDEELCEQLNLQALELKRAWKHGNEEGRKEEREKNGCPPHNLVDHHCTGSWGGSVPPPNKMCTKCLLTICV